MELGGICEGSGTTVPGSVGKTVTVDASVFVGLPGWAVATDDADAAADEATAEAEDTAAEAKDAAADAEDAAAAVAEAMAAETAAEALGAASTTPPRPPRPTAGMRAMPGT